MSTDLHFTKSQTASLTAAISCAAAVGIGLSFTIPLLSLEMNRMGASQSLIGVNTALAGVAGLLTVPFVPALARRLGVVTLLQIAVVVVAINLIAFNALRDLMWWFPLRFIFSVALGILFVLSEYWINAAAPAQRRGLVMGIYATVLAVGFAAGPFVLALVGTEGWPPYLAGAGLFGLATLPLLIAGNHAPVTEEAGERRLSRFILAAPVATFAALIFGAIETASFALLPIYGLNIGLASEKAAVLVSAMALGNVVCQIPLGLLSDRIDRRIVLFGAALAGTIGALLLPVFAESFLGLVLLLFVWGGLTGGLYTVGLAQLGSRFTGSDLVGANAAFIFLYNIGLLTGPPAVGFFMEIVPPNGFAWGLASICGLYLVLVGLRMLLLRR